MVLGGYAPPVRGANTEVWFYSNLTLAATNPTPCPDIVHLYVDTTVNPPVLKEQSLAGRRRRHAPELLYSGATRRGSSASTSRTRRRLPVFTYYYDDATGNPVAFTDRPDAAVGRQPLAGERGRDHARRSAQSTNYTVPYTTLINRVRLPNVDYNPLPSPSP